MRKTKLLLSALVAGALAGGGFLYAQVPDGGDDKDLPEVSATGETEATLSAREMSLESDRLIKEMEASHVRVLELQTAARKAKDVIKLNCVNEKLLAVKQLLNIAESAQTDLTEAISGGDHAQQVHDYGQVKLAHERSVAERDEAEGCIGEEIIFVGPTEVNVDGPDIPDDPTDDPDDPFTAADVDLERAAYASPWN
jgi:hypothetical protein